MRARYSIILEAQLRLLPATSSNVLLTPPDMATSASSGIFISIASSPLRSFSKPTSMHLTQLMPPTDWASSLNRFFIS